MPRKKKTDIINSEELTEVKEDYIRAIYVLKHRYNRTPMLNEITQYLGIKKTTVSEALKSLADDGFVYKQNYKPVDLTEKGLSIAKNLTWKHRLIEVFLHRMLKVDIDKVHQEAHKLEHALSDDVIDKIFDFLNNPTDSIERLNNLMDDGKILTCPHGQPLK
jgi:DtxR family Mn-dependent transcriptional regulator